MKTADYIGNLFSFKHKKKPEQTVALKKESHTISTEHNKEAIKIFHIRPSIFGMQDVVFYVFKEDVQNNNEEELRSKQ